jgi:3D-(3,5/4)-trihydroxycyclohexane-1,2-dione acylhydrolase (decyclizing)
MLTGAATATVNRLPVLLLPADTFATRRSGVVLQQLEHPLESDVSVNDAFRPLSRHFDRIARPEQLAAALPAAMRVLLDPAETGAVTVALHQDVLGEVVELPAAFFERRVWLVSRRPPAAEELAAAVALLRAARRPLIVAGGGVKYSEAEAALKAFTRRTGIPVAETSAGKGAMAGANGLGGLGVNGSRAANEIAARADLVLCAGTRLTDFTTASQTLFEHPDVRFVALNVNAADAAKLGGAPLVCDARLGLEALEDAVAPVAPEYRHEVEERRLRWEDELAADARRGSGGLLRQAQVYACLNAESRAGDWVVAAAGWAPGDVLKAWRVPEGGHAHVEFGFSCMGHEIPAGIGIRMRIGDAGEVLVVIGDGTYLMGASELLTAVQQRRKLTVVVLDNGGYGSIDALATGSTGASVGNRFEAADGGPLPMDFAANAASFGCRGVRAGTEAELHAALREAREQPATTVIHCPTAPGEPLLGSGAFWDLGVPEVATSELTLEVAGWQLAERARRRS